MLQHSDPLIMVKHPSDCKLKRGFSHRLHLVAEKQPFVKYELEELVLSGLLLWLRRHFLLDLSQKSHCSPLRFGCCSCFQPSHLLLIWHFLWLLEVSNPGLLQLCRHATAQSCAGALERVCEGCAGDCSCRLLRAWGWVWFGVVASVCPEQRGLNLLCSVQGSTSECGHAAHFRVVTCRAGVQQKVGLKWQDGTGFLHGRKDVLLGEAAETHFAPVLCCGPSYKRPRLSSPFQHCLMACDPPTPPSA